MITTEKQLYNNLKNRRPEYHWQRFEDRFSVGIPDTNVAAPSGEFWIELKVAKRVGGLIGVEMKPAQKAWAARRTKVLDNVWLCAYLSLAAQTKGGDGRRHAYPPIAFVRPKLFLAAAERKQVGKFTYHCLPLDRWNHLHDHLVAGIFL